MKPLRNKVRKTISEMVTPASVSTTNSNLHDIGEVQFIELYQSKDNRIKSNRPLIDMVNPQPKAFFAYLQMPTCNKTKAKGTPKAKPSTRVSRKKPGKK